MTEITSRLSFPETLEQGVYFPEKNLQQSDRMETAACVGYEIMETHRLVLRLPW